MSSHRARLEAEASHLRHLLERLDPDDWISRPSILERLDEVATEVSKEPARAPSLAITFKGEPVTGSEGIEARFTATALQNFTKFLTELANQVRAKLIAAESAVLPDFLVTGVATGSFGFVIEEKGSTAETTVLRLAGSLLDAATDDDRFEDALEETDTEVLTALTRFLSSLNSNGATVRLTGPDWRTSLDDAEMLRGAIKRTETVKDATEQHIKGILHGILPEARRFELREHPSQLVISGKVRASTMREKEIRFAQAFHKMGIATVRVRTFVRPWGGATRTSYELLDFEAVPEPQEDQA